MKFRHIPEIDGLRAVAVLSVIIYHGNFDINGIHLLPGGFLGVDIFFVISGYLITKILVSEYNERKTFSIKQFYIRRVRRILPALITVIAISSIAAWNYLSPSQLKDFSYSILASLAFISNFYWFETLGEYGAEAGIYKPFLHTWSLAVEEQFYLFYPLILLAVLKMAKIRALSLLAAIFLISLIYSQFTSTTSPSYSFFMLASRFWELLAGALLIFIHPSAIDKLPHKNLLIYAALSLILVSVTAIDINHTHPGLITLGVIIGSQILIALSLTPHPVNKFLSSRYITYVGLISYSLYLWHYPIFAIGNIITPNPEIIIKAFWIALTIILSIISYHLIEQPFRNKSKISLNTLLKSTAIASSATIILCILMINYSDYRGRLPTWAQDDSMDNIRLRKDTMAILNKTAVKAGYPRLDPKDTSEYEYTETWYKDARKANVLIVGNSHSKDFFNAMYLNRKAFNRLEFARYAISPPVNTAMMEQFLNSPNFVEADCIVISTRVSEGTLPLMDDFLEAIQSATAKKIILTSPNIDFLSYKGHEVAYDGYVKEQGSINKIKIDDINKLYYQLRWQEPLLYNQSLQLLAKKKQIPFIDKYPLTCDDTKGICYGATESGKKTYYDISHYTMAGAKFFGQQLSLDKKAKKTLYQNCIP